MASLQEIKTRSNSIATTKKITKAMQLVSTVKLLKAKKNLNAIKKYYDSVYEAFQNVLNSVQNLSKIMPQNSKKITLYILITSDLGLCGSYNENALKMLNKQILKNDKLIIIGSKGISQFKNDKRNLLIFEHIGNKPDYLISSDVAKEVISQYFTNKISDVKIIHTKFLNSINFETNTTKILPIEKKQKITSDKNLFVEFEPSPEAIVKNILPLYISAFIYFAMVESKVSEISSRRISMENATDNAENLISELDLQYNRARQSKITREISEIVTGSEFK